MLLCGIELSSAILLYGAYTEEVCCAASEAVRMESSRQPCCYSTLGADRTSTKHLHELGKTSTYGVVLLSRTGWPKQFQCGVQEVRAAESRESVGVLLLWPSAFGLCVGSLRLQ